jgi:hypothetical protein
MNPSEVAPTTRKNTAKRIGYQEDRITSGRQGNAPDIRAGRQPRHLLVDKPQLVDDR